MPEKKQEPKENKSSIDIEEMVRQGVHLGHRTSRLNPRMEDFVMGIKNTVHVIDLEKTAVLLEKALKFIAEMTEKGEVMLLCGTKVPLRTLVKEIAEACNLPYVAERWLGGTFTNFKVIAKRTQHFRELQEQKKEGKLEKYTKKERLNIEKELSDLKRKFEGIQNMENLPEAVFICDLRKDNLVLREAKAKGIKTIGIVDTNADPTQVDYPIPANDDALSSVRYILEKVAETIKKSKK